MEDRKGDLTAGALAVGGMEKNAVWRCVQVREGKIKK